MSRKNLYRIKARQSVEQVAEEEVLATTQKEAVNQGYQLHNSGRLRYRDVGWEPIGMIEAELVATADELELKAERDANPKLPGLDGAT